MTLAALRGPTSKGFRHPSAKSRLEDSTSRSAALLALQRPRTFSVPARATASSLPGLSKRAVAAYCWGFMTNNYTANVSLYVLTQTTNATDGTGRVTSSDTSASQQLANDLAKIAKTSTVMSSTASALGMSNLEGFDVGVTSDTTSRVITLTVTGKSPEGAASVANELADRTSKAAVDAMKLDAVNIIDRASVPDKPSGPNRVMYTAVALLAGLFVAIAIIVLQDMLDTTVKSGDDAEELLGIPVLGRMPKPKKAR